MRIVEESFAIQALEADDVKLRDHFDLEFSSEARSEGGDVDCVGEFLSSNVDWES